jgi:hypothetical protein
MLEPQFSWLIKPKKNPSTKSGCVLPRTYEITVTEMLNILKQLKKNKALLLIK